MATADWPENWPEDCTSESPNNQEADEEEDESYSLTHDTDSRPTESKEAPKHPGIPELESIPSHVEMDLLQRSAGSFRYVCVRACVNVLHRALLPYLNAPQSSASANSVSMARCSGYCGGPEWGAVQWV